MEFTQEKINSSTVIRFAGRLDAAAVRDHRDEIGAIADAAGSAVILNLAGIDFIDSSGLGFVVSLLKRVDDNGNKLSICNMTPQTKTLFELTRMTRIFTIYDTEEMAVQTNN